MVQIPKQSAQSQALEALGEASFSWGASQTFLKHIITTLLVGSVISLIALRIVAPEQILRMAAPVLVLLVAGLGWVLLLSRQIQATIYVLSFGIWAVLTGAAWFTDGVRAPVVIAYPVIILTMAWMISARAALLVTAMTVLVTVWLALAEAGGYLPKPLPSSLVMHGGDQIVIYLLTAILAVFLVRAYQGRLQELARVGAALSLRTRDLEASKAELHRAQAVANVGSWAYDIGSGVMRCSTETRRIFALADSPVIPYADYLERIHPDDRPGVALAWQAAFEGQDFDNEIRIVVRGATHWVRQKAELTYAVDGTALSAMGTSQDISQRKQAEQHELFRSEILEHLSGSEALADILDAIVRGVERLDQAMLCSILLLDREGRHLGKGVAPSLPDFYNAALEGIEVGMGVGSCGTAAFTGERVVAEDISTHPYWAPYKELAAQADLGACWSQPILAASGQVLGTFAIYHRSAHSPAPADIAIIEQSAHLASIAIEKDQAAANLRASEEHHRAMVEWTPESIIVHRAGVIIYVNPAAVSLFGAQVAGDLIGRATRELIHPDSLEVQTMRMRNLMERVPIKSMVESKFLRLDGTPIDVEVQGTAIEYDGAPAIHVSVRDISERKQAEEKLQLAASVFTHAGEGIMITAADGTIIDVNQAFTRITGYSRDEALGQNPRLLNSGRHTHDFFADMWQSLSVQGHWFGEVWNRRKSGEVYVEVQTISAVGDALGNTRQYVALFSDITAAKEHQRQLEHIAHYDALTSLPNRSLLADRLHQAMAQAVRRSQRLAVVFLDLDGFKAVNDKHGHEAGDQLLIALAAQMKLALREGDSLARMGGDEFVAVLVDLDDVAATLPLLNRLLAAAAQAVRVGDLQLQVSASLGVTFYPQHEDVDADQLLRQADQAMYQAKLAGKNRSHVFDSAQDSSVRGHHESLERIQTALNAREFVLHYQPKVNMRTGVVTGVEALIRWQHPQRGLLAPAMFLPVIEDHGLAVEVGEWVIASALQQMVHWRTDGLDLRVSVNVGARQLQQNDFVARLQAILEAHPEVKPGDLELEVLETSALEDVGQISRLMQDCRELGVSFALDDFGTGYSSLTYLKRLPVSVLKIDQSFVRDMLDDPDDLAILQGVIGLATAFRREVIAEGVETDEHGSMLLQLGCELAQGYGIARPMPAHELPAWVASWKPAAAWVDLPPTSRDDFPLLFARVEYRGWVLGVDAFLQGDRTTPPALGHQQFHLCNWLETDGLARHGASQGFERLVSVLHGLHELAATLCELHSRDRQLALHRRHELHALRDQLLEHLQSLVRE